MDDDVETIRDGEREKVTANTSNHRKICKGLLSLAATERDSNSPTSIISTAYAFEKREYCYEEGSFRGALEFSAKLLS